MAGVDTSQYSQEARDEIEAMTPVDKAAVLLLLLGEDQASDIISYMNPKEVQKLGAAMVNAADLSQDAINYVLDDFVMTLKGQSSLGIGATEYVTTVLNRALGADKAASVMGRIMPEQGSKGLEVLRWMDARAISDMIMSEHPQVIAIILSVLDYDVAASVLSYLPIEIRPEIMHRVGALEVVQPAAMQELEAIMKKQFSNNSSARSSTVGGVKQAAQIMNFAKVEMETQVMAGLAGLDEEMANQIQDQMFVFDNLLGVDNKAVQIIMRNVDQDQLMTALKGASDGIKEKFFDNMSARARIMFIDDMEAKGPMRLSDVELAQKDIMRTARKLSDAGEIVLMSGGGDFV